MPSKTKGSAYPSCGSWWAAITVGKKRRKHVKLETCTGETDADARAAVIASIAARLRKAGKDVETVTSIVEQAAASSPTRLKGVLVVVAGLCDGTESQEREEVAGTTFGTFAEEWTSGRLATKFPGNVGVVDHKASLNIGRLDKHILPYVKDVPLAAFTLEHAEEVLRKPTLPAGSRRHVAQLMHRVLRLAVYPGRIVEHSPIPPKWLPSPNARKAGSFLYPEEDAKLLAKVEIPFIRRLLVGMLAREGMRSSEAAGLAWSDLDLDRGAVNLDENKTDDPRAWALSRGVVEALTWWRDNGGKRSSYVLSEIRRGEACQVNVRHLAKQLRADLEFAGVEREALFEASKSRMRLRAHDLRATFVTLALAAGRSETWVADRTGHKSSQMIQRYRRAARTVAELGVGELLALSSALPEVSENVGKTSADKGETVPTTSEHENKLCDGGESNPQALRRRNLKPPISCATSGIEQHPASNVALDRDSIATDPDSPDTSPTLRRLARSPLGRATSAAIHAALRGDRSAIETSLWELAELHGRELVGGDS